MRWTVIFMIVSSCIPLSAQVKKLREYDRTFQLSLFPGMSTNGMYSGSYYNTISLNIFGGLSAGSNLLEIGFISNLNLKKSNGIQIAGLANVVGSNAFVNLTVYEERQLIQEGFESNFKGIQVAGILNYVRTHLSGIQLAGLFNSVGLDANGFQLAGIGNGAGGSVSGVQIAGLFNLAVENMGGFQISCLYNYTKGTLSGLQLGLINTAARTMGKYTTPPTKGRGFQIGLINFSKAMHGTQIGLINFGGGIRGKQIGLINFFRKYPSKELVHNGTPIGLLNFGSKGSYFRFYYNELFSTNVEFTTGNCLNCSWVMGSEMPFHERYKKFNQNALMVGYDHFQQTWGFGWGFQKVLYNKFSVAPHVLNERKMIAYGIRFMHLNRDLSFDNTFNLLNRLNIDFGRRWKSRYVFAGVSLNYFLREPEEEATYTVNSLAIATGEVMGMASEFWPGYTIGLQF